MSSKIFIQSKKAIPVYDKEGQKIGDGAVEEETLIGIVESWEKVDVRNKEESDDYNGRILER